jgi:hypothetical protein
MSSVLRASILLAAMAVAHVSEAGQPPALLAISSPSAGAIVRPGQTLSVTVTSPANAQFEFVSVLGGGQIAKSNRVTSLPAQLSLAIPGGYLVRTDPVGSRRQDGVG